MEAHAHILVANEPATYREVLVSELTHLRPHLTVVPVPPTALDLMVVRVRPRLVICSALTATVCQHASASIVLYPDGFNQAIVIIAEQRQVLPNPSLTDLLAAVDDATQFRAA